MRTLLWRHQGGHLSGRILLAILLAITLVSPFGAGQERIKLERPVMMDSNGPGSEVFVLDAAGRLHELRLTQNNLEQYRSVALPNEFVPADMTYVSSGGQESLLIAGTESGLGVVVNYSLDGRALKTWNFRNICSGIDFAPKSHSAYVATSDSKEIYQLDLNVADIKFVTRIEDASKLGPLAYDEGGRRIYVADVASGRIYEYSAATKKSRVMVTGFSAPTAIAFDSETSRLFIADPGRRGIFTVDTRSSGPVAVEVAPNLLKAPYGLTLISENRLAVADYGANAVLVFSLKGELLFRFP